MTRGMRVTEQEYCNLACLRNLEWLGPYPNRVRDKTWWQCQKGHKWETSYNSILAIKPPNTGCPFCLRISPQGYHDLAQEKNFEWLGPYPPNVLELTNWRCSSGHEWLAKYANIYSNKGCPYCAGVAKKTEQDYHVKAGLLGFEWLGPYTGWVKDETNWRCSKGHEWPVSYDSLSGCSYCWRISEQDYYDLAQSLGFEWIGPYPSNVNIKTNWRCPKGHEWPISYNNLKRCPECNGFKGPTRIKAVLRDMGIDDFETEKRFPTCRHKLELPFDFFMPSAKLLIEYQGEHHFKSIWGPLSNVKRNDKIKADWAAKSQYELLLINYDEFDHIAEILFDKLKDYALPKYYKQGKMF